MAQDARLQAAFPKFAQGISLDEWEYPQEDRAVVCAASLFLRDGIGNVKMTDIAREANVGVATLYRHFSTKSRLAIAAGTLMWRRINAGIHDLVESGEFLRLNGLSRLEALLAEYCEVYVAHPTFVRFLDEFDHLVLAEGVQKSELEEYGREVDSFYLIFDDAYLLGRQDGSIKRVIEFNSYYHAVAHDLMGVAEKFTRGEIIPSDDFSAGEKELRCIVQMAVLALGTEN